MLRVEVEDTGIGIAEEDRTRLFRPFEQAQNGHTRAFGGTGLGLVISRRLAQLMGGDCGATSVAGRGSTFWFTVRLRRGVSAKPVEASRGGQLRQCASVLLAEDNEVNQAVAGAMLRALGLQVEIARHGGEAVEKFATGRHDLVLMDLQMPVMDGLEAARSIRALDGGRDVPIIAMTASAFAEDRERCLEAGMNGHVAKPVELERLRRVLAEWLPAPQPAMNRSSASIV
jgi:CheY-like chemotaxis protein